MHARLDLPHGGRLRALRRSYPDAPEPLLDLSTGINPHPYALAPMSAEVFTRLPEPEDEQALLAAAAQAYGTSQDCVATAPGTQIVISLLPRLFPRASVAVLGPTYGEHAASWRAGGATVREIAHLDARGDAEAVVVCTPNNPDGCRTSLDGIERAAERGFVVVDEAFADLDEAPSAATLLPHPRLVVLRSFGKTYGLAGLRLGFALAHPSLAETIRAALGPWAVSGPALAAGIQALPDAAWRAAQGARLARDVPRLDALLGAAGITVVGGTCLFRLGSTPSAGALHDRLGAAGILVRRFDARPDWLRFGLPGTEAAFARLAAALGTG